MGFMWRSTFALLAIALVGSSSPIEIADGCTTIGGGEFTTHNDDCRECDYRMTKVPAADWPAGSRRPIADFRSPYPRYVETPESNIHGPDYLTDIVDRSTFNFTVTQPIFYIDQVPHTYGYTLATYGVQNEKQVSIGESTCGAVFSAAPVFAGGKASINIGVLTEIALEWCATARCAITTMGGLATKHGFYGPDWLVGGEVAQSDAGEALVVADPQETWVFHLLPDDTGTSAVWVAQRVPDGHIAVVANQFVIGVVDFEDPMNFMWSENIVKVAVRNGLYTKLSTVDTAAEVGGGGGGGVDSTHAGDGGKSSNKVSSAATETPLSPASQVADPFNFMQIYGLDLGAQSYQATRRIWRIYTLAAPSLLPHFSPYTDAWGTFGFGPDGSLPYPFSVAPDRRLAVADIIAYSRDQFEGTVFDVTAGLDAGPFGDPARYQPVLASVDPAHGVTAAQAEAGTLYNRAVSVARTSYSVVALNRGHMPDAIGAVVYMASYAPHHSVYVPVYSNAVRTPLCMRNSSLYKFDSSSLYWVHSLAGNYLSRWYRHTIGDVVAQQRAIETNIFARQAAFEAEALAALRKSTDNSTMHSSSATAGNTSSSAQASLTQMPERLAAFHESVASGVLAQWWGFFHSMVVRYRDNLKVSSVHVDNILDNTATMTVQRSWLESIGFWGAPFTPAPGRASPDPIYPINIPTLPSAEAYTTAYPLGLHSPYTWYSPFSQQQPVSPLSADAEGGSASSPRRYSQTSLVIAMLAAALFGAAVGAYLTMWLANYRNNNINNNNNGGGGIVGGRFGLGQKYEYLAINDL